jgi:MarR family transcriptional regulator, temperature-dependent positive regulator of motility
MSQDELKLRVMRALELDSNRSQRELAKELGVSLGGVNYCVKALIDVGWIKADNFARSQDKRAYAYLLTAKGIAEKTALTARFLRYKMGEYEALKAEIEQLKSELADEKPL